MEEIFQLVLGLFVVALPILSLIGRRRRTAWERRDAAERAARLSGDDGELQPQPERRSRRSPQPQPTAEPRLDPQARPSMRSPADARSGSPERGRAPERDRAVAGSTPVQPRRGERGSGIGEEALARIEGLPRMQKAFIWSQVFGRPKALRRTPDPWDE